MAHPFFRKRFYEDETYAPRFINLFWRANNLDVDSYIAIDFNRVRVNVDNLMYIECDTWYGASFNKEISQIKNCATKFRPSSEFNNSDISHFFDDAYSLDISWNVKSGIKIFQAEEFKTEKVIIKVDGKCYYPARYIHAEFDLNSGFFRHFDGAVHLYTEDEYFRRRDSDFNYNLKHNRQIKSNSQKLFKINGEVSVDTWIEYTSHFFTGNPLIIEYFEGKYPDYIAKLLAYIRQKKLNADSDW